MKKHSKVIAFMFMLILVVSITGCASYDFAEESTIIVTAADAIELAKDENVVLIDAQSADDYANGHAEGAVNISLSEVVVNTPFPNMLAPKEQIEKIMGQNGISNDTTVIIYDNINNMDASRIWWTLLVYGHENAKVVSGGLNALRNANGNANTYITTDIPNIKQTTFKAQEANTAYIATKKDVEALVNVPDDNVVLIDTRSPEEYNMGTIPGSLNINYIKNDYVDGTIKSASDIQIMYIEKGLTPEKTAITYCKTSIRGAQTFVALWNAGYRNIKLYDGAWAQWSADKEMPSDNPSDNQKPIESNDQDNS